MSIMTGANGQFAARNKRPINPKTNITCKSKTEACSANVQIEHRSKILGIKYTFGMRSTYTNNGVAKIPAISKKKFESKQTINMPPTTSGLFSNIAGPGMKPRIKRTPKSISEMSRYLLVNSKDIWVLPILFCQGVARNQCCVIWR